MAEEQDRTAHHDKLIATSKIAHDSIRSFRQTLNDNSLPAWELTDPDYQTKLLKNIMFCLEGERTVDQIHVNWCATQSADGWKYGLIYNETQKEDPRLKPFENLDFETQMTYGLIISIAIWASAGLARSAQDPTTSLVH